MSDTVDTEQARVEHAADAANDTAPSSDPTPALELDCRGMNCPLPILKAKKAITTVQIGEIVKMVATDPGSIPDVAAFSRRTGHETVQQAEADGVYTFWLKRTK